METLISLMTGTKCPEINLPVTVMTAVNLFAKAGKLEATQPEDSSRWKVASRGSHSTRLLLFEISVQPRLMFGKFSFRVVHPKGLECFWAYDRVLFAFPAQKSAQTCLIRRWPDGLFNNTHPCVVFFFGAIKTAIKFFLFDIFVYTFYWVLVRA